ncbi:hypothetical protein JCM3774_005725 [Rhodotorula dairenensis]
MLASLAGGASCGPTNPLQQLSKTYTADRGAQQDHFAGSHAGPSGQHSFRASAPSSNAPDSAAQQFFQQQHHAQPFNLSPLHHALPPATAGTSAATPPAWAQAFVAQAPVAANNATEQEMFARAFGRGGSGGAGAGAASSSSPHFKARDASPAWVGDFHASSSASSGLSASPALQQQQQQGLSRLQGQGFAMHPGPAGLMVNYQRPAGVGGMQMMVTPESMAAAREQEGKADWDHAFETRQADVHAGPAELISDRILPATVNETDFSSHLHETRPLTPPLRAHSPVADDQAARDALAETAANLLSTVRSAEEQRLRATAEAPTQVGDKFAQSSFMQLMRQLRDGQVAVEGDKVVEQQPQQQPAARDKGKARADGWASDFAATTNSQQADLHRAFDREEEGRVNSTAAAAPVLRPGQSVASHAHQQHAWAHDQAESARLVRELQDGFQAMHGLWDDEDRARAAREELRTVESNGKGKEREPFMFQGDGGNLVDSDREDQLASTHVPLAQASWEEDFDDPSMIVGGHALGGGVARKASVGRMSAQQMEWDMLQRDWDEMDATSTGFRPPRNQVEATGHGYSFAQNNPYIHMQMNNGASTTATTHHHAQHAIAATATDDLSAALTERHDSLLQREAEVLREPHSASAWLSLGLKQQQNEREELAIAALRRATELDPYVADGAAHLALAVSYTNEGRRTDAYDHLNKWVDAIAQQPQDGGSASYANEIAQYRNLFGAALPNSIQDRQVYLSNMLIRLAQSRAERSAHGGADAVDADVQVALGVLFNSSEEYEKASDCFEAALSVRPDDPLLFNRLGATYANSGKTDAAMQYYHAALDLDPGYVRARYNLAVACMNVGKHEDAVHHLLTSLSIQEADSELDNLQQGPPSAESGHVSHALWDMLHVSLLQMHRSDVAPLAAAHDLRQLLEVFASER